MFQTPRRGYILQSIKGGFKLRFDNHNQLFKNQHYMKKTVWQLNENHIAFNLQKETSSFTSLYKYRTRRYNLSNKKVLYYQKKLFDTVKLTY